MENGLVNPKLCWVASVNLFFYVTFIGVGTTSWWQLSFFQNFIHTNHWSIWHIPLPCLSCEFVCLFCFSHFAVNRQLNIYVHCTHLYSSSLPVCVSVFEYDGRDGCLVNVHFSSNLHFDFGIVNFVLKKKNLVIHFSIRLLFCLLSYTLYLFRVDLTTKEEKGGAANFNFQFCLFGLAQFVVSFGLCFAFVSPFYSSTLYHLLDDGDGNLT